MAVLDSLPGIEVTVSVDGEALSEYDAQNDKIDHNDRAVARHQSKVTTTKFIESTTGKAFLVKIEVKAPFKMNCHNISFTLYVDGQHMRTPLLSKNRLAKSLSKNPAEWSCLIEGPIEKVRSRGVAKIMHFAEIQSTEEVLASAVIEKQSRQTSKVGEIAIFVHRRSGIKKTRAHRSATNFQELDSAEKVHSKVLIKDGKSHSVSLKDNKPVRLGRTVCSTEVDGRDYPIAVYRFKYCSLKSLQDLHFVPRAETPEPVVMDSPPQVPQQVEEVASRTASLAGDLGELSSAIEDLIMKAVKRVTDGINNPVVKSEKPLSSVKRECLDDDTEVSPSKRAKCTKKKPLGRMIIDLTEEDD